MDALLGKGFKTSKFKSLVELLSSRIAAVEKKHWLRCMQSQCDVIDLLKLGHQESALLHVEFLIGEQNILDTYAMIENFCLLLVERVVLIAQNRECPEELKEPISSLIFAASKCGKLPELEKISGIFTKRFGKEFANNALALCNNCGVCPKIVSKLSTQKPDSERKLAMLREIALANEINLHQEADQDQSQMETKRDTKENLHEHRHEVDRLFMERKKYEKLSAEASERRQYKDFKAAAQAAYKLASQAAFAAKVAVELCPRKSSDTKHLGCFVHEASGSEIVNVGDETLESIIKAKENESESLQVHSKLISASIPCRVQKTENSLEGHLKRD